MGQGLYWTLPASQLPYRTVMTWSPRGQQGGFSERQVPGSSCQLLHRLLLVWELSVETLPKTTIPDGGDPSTEACYVGKGEENFNRSHKELVFTKTSYLTLFRPGHCPWLCSSLTPDPRHNGLTLPYSSAAPQAWHSLSDNLCRQDLLALSESWTVFLLRLWVLGRQQRHDLSPVIKLMNFEWMNKWIQIMELESPDLLHIIWDALGLI